MYLTIIVPEAAEADYELRTQTGECSECKLNSKKVCSSIYSSGRNDVRIADVRATE